MLLSLDISTSITGYCVFDLTGNIIEIGNIILNKEKDFFKKIDLVKQKLIDLNNDYNLTHVAIEEAFQSFGRGLSSAKTLFTLAKFNGTIQYIIYTLGLNPTVINVNNARKLVGIKVDKKSKTNTKDQVFEQVKLRETGIIWPTKVLKGGPNKGTTVFADGCYDMADAYVIGKAYIVENLGASKVK